MIQLHWEHIYTRLRNKHTGTYFFYVLLQLTESFSLSKKQHFCKQNVIEDKCKHFQRNITHFIFKYQLKSLRNFPNNSF